MTESSGQLDAAKLIVTVRAGVVPGVEETRLMRSYVLSSSSWERAGGDGEAQLELLAQFNGGPMGYAAFLQLRPNELNWVTTEWVWL